MQLIIKVEANEIRKVDEMTYYNHIVWELTRHDKMGITHIKEIYDDVSDYPRYELGIVLDGKFKTLLAGEGDPMPVKDLGFGGVWTEIGIYTLPDFSAKQPSQHNESE